MNKTSHSNRHYLPKIKGTLFIVFAILSCLCTTLLFVGCGGSKASSDQGVRVEMISIRPMAGNDKKVKLELKVTNVSGKDILRAKALITVLDGSGSTLGTKSTYIINSQQGGLAAGASTDDTTFVDVKNSDQAERFSFKMESVRFKE